jgi:hypothetical protein
LAVLALMLAQKLLEQLLLATMSDTTLLDPLLGSVSGPAALEREWSDLAWDFALEHGSVRR